MTKLEELEKKDFDLFISLSSIEFISVNHACEKPDCDAQTKETNIGIEITEFVRSKKNNSELRSVSDTLFGLKNEIESEIRKITNRNLTINYSRQTPVTRKIKSSDKRKIVEFLANHLRKKEVYQKLNEEFYYFEFDYSQFQNEFIESVRISSYPGKKGLTISENKSYLIGVIPQPHIESIIEEKESKMDFLRNTETWLLIVIAQEDYSCGIIDSTVLNYKFAPTLFKRVFLLERASKKLSELNLSV